MLRNATLAVFAFLSFNNVNAQWEAVNTGLTSNNVNDVLACGPNLLAATDAGMFISTDNGTSWTAITAFAGVDVKDLAINGSNVYSASYGNGIMLSTDNGVTWNAKNAGFPYNYACAVATHGANVYASITSDHVYKSTDNGTTWTAVTDATLDGITVNAMITSGSNLIASSGSCNGATDGGVYLSTDGGTTWSATSVIDDTDWLEAMGSYVFAPSGTGVFKSNDNGATWTATANASGIIDNAIAAINVGSYLVVGCPYSVYTSTDNGATWVDFSAGAGGSNLSVTSFTKNSTYLFLGNIYHPVGVWRIALSDLGVSAGMQSETTIEGLNIYPNPVNDALTVNLTEYRNAMVQIFTVEGQLVQTHILCATSTSIDMSDLSKGSYLVKIKSAGSVAVTHIVKN